MTVQQRVSTALLLVAAAANALAAPARLPQDLESRNTMLAAAVRAGDTKQISELLDGGANPNSKDATGNPVLMLAAVYGSATVMQLLLDRGADPNAVNAAGASALHWSSGDPAKARLLIGKGANVDAKSGPGRTPLAIAAAQDGNFDIVKLLVEKGADVNAHDNLEGMVFTGGGKDTPLIEAAKTRDIRTVRYLLDHGADVNASNHVGATALTEAALRGSEEIARLLIDRGGDVNHRLKPPFGSTAIVLAAMRGSAPMVDLLLSKGATANDADGAGSTALMWAAYNDRIVMEPVARLLAAGANVKAKNVMGETALIWAARRGTTPVVALLRKAGADSGAPVSAAAANITTSTMPTPELKDAVARSLTALDKGGPQFFKVSGCVSCHNQTLPLMATSMARLKQVQPNEKVEQQQMKSVLAVIKPALEILAENTDVVPDIPVTGPNVLQALSAQNYPADDVTSIMVHNLAAKQLKDGSWFGWGVRPPIEAGDIQATALCVRALQLYGPAGRKAEFDTRIAHAREWLRKAKAVTTEEKIMRLAGLAWSHAGRDDVRAAADAVIADQHQDGGWGQLSGLESDAYATGKALVALHEAINISTASSTYRTGVDYLLRTQKDDGSWQVKTRVFPFQPLKESGFPHGRDQWISAAGTSWAAMALSYAAEPQQVASR